MTEGALAAAKRGVVYPLQKYLLNPLDKLAFRLGIPPPGDALLETVGRRTGNLRVTPVCDGLVGETFWLIAQRGRDSDYVRNIETNPRVRVRVRSGWRTELPTSSTTTTRVDAGGSMLETMSGAGFVGAPPAR